MNEKCKMCKHKALRAAYNPCFNCAHKFNDNFEHEEKSAFQKWEVNQVHYFNSYLLPPYPEHELLEALRKDGWNAAIDEVLKHFSGIKEFHLKQIRELKEP